MIVRVLWFQILVEGFINEEHDQFSYVAKEFFAQITYQQLTEDMATLDFCNYDIHELF